MSSEAAALVEALGLEPHPEGGWYRETWRGPSQDGRSVGTAIYYLLEDGQRSHWHRVDADEIWHWYGGVPLTLSVSDGGPAAVYRLGPAGADSRPQAVVPAGHWQSAAPEGGWSLCGCTVSPGFEFEGFEMAPDGWSPEDMEAST